jgi:flagellar hook-associated protein 2
VVLNLLELLMEGAMGTVGLSFGSPTSGTGFDVSSTVASIVSNLQNVETPWKSQLTKLESQDTAISSLGTLFSNLSNDMSALTDFQGIMALKTGNSSDTNVVEITAADYTAAAGTHTVVVNNLAQTSSGYLDAVANASDTLSGSISIGVNGGNPSVIQITSSNNTLSTLASAINSAGIGVTASVLTDSAGSRLSLVSGTSGANGKLNIASSITDASMVSSTNSTGAVNYHSTADGKDASLTVDGVPLTSASNTVANLIPGITLQLLAPSATGEQVQVVIGNDNTAVESTVNSLVSDYNSLISAINAQEGNDSSGNSEPLFGSPTLSLLQQQLLGGLNTQSPNGYLDSISKSSDTLSGSISIAVDGGTATAINVPSSDNTLSGLATAINSAAIGVKANVVTDSSGSRLVLVSNTAGSSGALTVTSSITDTATSTALNYNSSGSDINSLTSLGISVNNNGSLTLDATSLDSVLNSDYSSVVGFFQNANSWGQAFSTTLTNAGTSSPTGILKLAGNANSTVESSLNADISKEEITISAERVSLTAELNSANEVLQQLPSQLQGVNELYSAITGYNQGSNG